ncbi:shikimate kinase [Clostridium sp. 19966]|uniref:shikimate kinase n=1 Tax=Clostridium sp. 19966 TaxID=2768166 RepID=UPI0028DE3375|nr:shikimate kinase [Clostridium sp. 19966]MDT8718096.1 shikimate kinase [Clostridium sp. 19966]
MKKNISLIGMPGAGKSTIGVILAKMIGYPFLDTDLLIQEKQGLLLSEIIEKYGVEAFLDIEEKTISQLECKKSVIATGGSVVYKDYGMRNLKKLGYVIYLKVSYEEIEKRLENIKARGVVIEDGKNLKNLYDERAPLYEKYADIQINCDGKNIESIAEEIKIAVSK